MDPNINLDVLDKDTTYNPLVGGFKSGEGGDRREAQSYSGWCSFLLLIFVHKSGIVLATEIFIEIVQHVTSAFIPFFKFLAMNNMLYMRLSEQS